MTLDVPTSLLFPSDPTANLGVILLSNNRPLRKTTDSVLMKGCYVCQETRAPKGGKENFLLKHLSVAFEQFTSPHSTNLNPW